MILTLEQIKSITVGALNVWNEDDVIRFAKCTSKQVDAWYKLDKVLGFRAETTTGVRLDFHTNSKMFAFTPQIKGEYERYEIYIDGIFSYYYTKEDFVDDRRKEIFLDDQTHRITLYLPGHEIGVLKSVEIDDGATVLPHIFDCKILFIGDSITQGWDSTWDTLSYAHNISRFFNAESVIQGIGGSYYHSTVFDEEIEFDPDVVIVAYGTNDWKHYQTIEEGKAHCSQFLDQLVKRFGNKKLFGILPIWRGDKKNMPAMGSFELCTSYVKEEIEKHDMILIDGEILVPHFKEFFLKDSLHPNTGGFEICALNLIIQLQQKF